MKRYQGNVLSLFVTAGGVADGPLVDGWAHRARWVVGAGPVQRIARGTARTWLVPFALTVVACGSERPAVTGDLQGSDDASAQPHGNATGTTRDGSTDGAARLSDAASDRGAEPDRGPSGDAAVDRWSVSPTDAGGQASPDGAPSAVGDGELDPTADTPDGERGPEGGTLDAGEVGPAGEIGGDGAMCSRVGQPCVEDVQVCCAGSLCTGGAEAHCALACIDDSDCQGSVPGCCLPLASGAGRVCAAPTLCP